MDKYKLGDMETKFAEFIWDSAPVPSGELVRLCENEFHWKKSTTYTMLKRLCERGLFQNSQGMVTPLLSREDFAAAQSESFVEETFSGSLPQFLAAFTRRKRLSPAEVEEIQRFIDQYQEEEKV